MLGMRRLCFAALCALALAGCQKYSGDAIVLEKEYIAARTTVDESAKAERDTPLDDAEVKERELAADEVVVDSYLMKKADRGTPRDPRAQKDEQWFVKVQTVDGGRQFNTHVPQTQFEKLNPGDRVGVTYYVGKYTGTVWGSKIK